MDEKSAMENGYERRSPLPQYQQNHDSSLSTASNKSRPRSRLILYIIASLFSFFIINYGWPIQLSSFYMTCPKTRGTQPTPDKSNHTGLVPLEAHVMSKCPDAKRCLEELVVPAMEQVVDMVDFRLSYIGSVDNNDTLRTYDSEIKSSPSRPVSEAENFSPLPSSFDH